MVLVLLRDLDEDAPRGMEQVPGDQEAVPQVGQVGVDAQIPGVAVGLHHLRLAHHELVVSVFRSPAAHEGLEIRAVLHAVGRVEVDRLDPTAHSFEAEQGVHHQQRIPEDQPVRPVFVVFVGAQHPFVERDLPFAEEARRQRLGAALHGGEDRLRRQPLVDEQRQRGNLEGEPLRLPRPVEEGLREGLQGVGVGGGLLQLPERRREFLRRRSLLSPPELPDQVPQPLLQSRQFLFRLFPLRVLAVPVERRGEGRVVAELAGRFPGPEVRVGPDVRPLGGRRLRVLVGQGAPLGGGLGLRHTGVAGVAGARVGRI